MKLFELIDTLKQYDPASDVVIASTPYGGYFNFTVKEQRELAVTERAPSGAVTFEVTDEVSEYTLTL